MGKALAKLKHRPEAIERFRQAIQLNPDYWEAHFELAGELAFDDKVPEAKAEFAEAVRIQPANPRSHFNLGVMLAKQKQLDEAQHEFEETLRFEPNNQIAVTYLAQVKALKSRKP
jgi:Flp pilus assembly protein TadD